jgi:energy-coupling factor transport system ATP-binding protein
LVEVQHLTYQYPGTDAPVLRDINLSVEQGEFVGIVGAAGAGKSTLCLCLTGLIPQTLGGTFDGRVLLDGRSTTSAPVAQVLHGTPGTALAGITFQDPESQIVGLTVEEDLAFGLENLGIPAGEMEVRIQQVLDRLDIADLRQAFPYHLSGGQKQRVAIAAALALAPRVLILDEPTSELDPLGKEQVFRIVESLKHDRDLTVVCVEHNVEELVKYADRVVVLAEGRIALEGTPREVFSRVSDLEAFGVSSPDVTRLSQRLTPSTWLTLDEAREHILSALGTPLHA